MSKKSRGFSVCLLCLCMFLVIPFNLTSVPNTKELVSIDSWVYEGLDVLYRDLGKVVPFTARPYTTGEFLYYLEAIDEHSLSESGKTVKNRIHQALIPAVLYEQDDTALSFQTIITPEFYYYTPVELIRDEGSQHYLNGFAHRYKDKLPILSMPLRFWAGNYLYMQFDIDIKEHPGIGVFPSTTFTQNGAAYRNWSNIPMGFDHIYHHFPDSYYLTFGDTHWNLYLGSGKYSVGVGKSGNFILSSDADKIPAARLSWYNKNFRYNFTYISLDPGLGNSGSYRVSQAPRMALDLPFLTQGYNQDIYGDNYLGYMDVGLYPYKGYLTHSFEFRFLQERVYIGITEAAVYARAVPELFNLIPLTIWHNGNNGAQTNSLLALDVQIALLPSLHLYASGVLDQFTMGHESGETEPEAHGFLVGATGSWPVFSGYMSAQCEYVYTNDWLYTHTYWLQTPTITQRNTSIARGGYNVRLLGFEKGNAVSQFQANLSYAEYGNYMVALRYTYTDKGPYDVFMRLPIKEGGQLIDPKGDRSSWPHAISHQVGIVGEYQVDDSIKIFSKIYATHVQNYKHQLGENKNSFECMIGVQFDPMRLFNIVR